MIRKPKQPAECITDRECGSCYACCVHLGIEELRKHAGTACRHLDGRNGPERRCSVYARRPIACVDFYCLWRTGLFGPGDRPDSSGVLGVAYEHEGELFLTLTITDPERSGGVLDAGRPLVRMMAEAMKTERFAQIRVVNYRTMRGWIARDGRLFECELQRPSTFEELAYIGTRQVATYAAMSPQEADALPPKERQIKL
jgi:hypothetical protein